MESTIRQILTRGVLDIPGLPPQLVELVVAQSKYETGNYKSDVYFRCKNAFGYTYVNQSGAYRCSDQPARDGGLPYAGYASVSDSAIEILKYIHRRVKDSGWVLNKIVTPEQYATLLKNRGYFGVSVQQYANGIKAYLKPVGLSPIEAGGVSAGLLTMAAFIGAGFVAYKILSK